MLLLKRIALCFSQAAVDWILRATGQEGRGLVAASTLDDDTVAPCCRHFFRRQTPGPGPDAVEFWGDKYDEAPLGIGVLLANGQTLIGQVSA